MEIQHKSFLGALAGGIPCWGIVTIAEGYLIMAACTRVYALVLVPALM